MFFNYLIILWLYLLALPLYGQQQQLTPQQVPTIMKQILDQHVDQKEMNIKTLKMGFKVYIDQFDPTRSYLLASEVNPYINPTDSFLSKALSDYQKGQFQAFEELNKTIQASIMRSRALRKQIKSNARPLFYMTAATPDEVEWNDPDLNRPFPNSVEELKMHISDKLTRFIQEEKHKFGEQVVINNQPQTLALFDKRLLAHENSYLFIAENGASLTPKEQQSAFTLHILKALASSLDAHTTFYNPAEAQDLKMRLQKNIEGIGIDLKKTSKGTIIISSLVKNGPADKSQRIKIGDIVIAINGQLVADKPFESVLKMLQATDSKAVRLLLAREEQKPFEVTLHAENIDLEEERVDVAYEQFGDGIVGVITLHSFYQGKNGITSENDMRQAILQLQKKGPLKGLIIDLRDNSGGFLIQAVKVAGLFITNGVVVISKYFNGEEHFYRDVDGKSFYDGPLVVLTSRATASAAEIVAQALQDYGVALIVGDAHTYGKGTIQNQTVTKTSGSSLFKVTVGKYYTPSGKTPQLDGVKADIFVPGYFNYEHIGEKFLTATIAADTIPEDFSDSLKDLTPLQKKWFQSNYLPTLQQKQSEWRGMLSELQLKSAERIAHSRGYQSFLRKLQNKGNGTYNDGFVPNFDYQLREALNIVHDMIDIKASKAQREVVLENFKPLQK